MSDGFYVLDCMAAFTGGPVVAGPFLTREAAEDRDRDYVLYECRDGVLRWVASNFPWRS